jgi:hypothetical protein
MTVVTEEWVKPLRAFPGYSVNPLGQVRKDSSRSCDGGSTQSQPVRRSLCRFDAKRGSSHPMRSFTSEI